MLSEENIQLCLKGLRFSLAEGDLFARELQSILMRHPELEDRIFDKFCTSSWALEQLVTSGVTLNHFARLFPAHHDHVMKWALPSERLWNSAFLYHENREWCQLVRDFPKAQTVIFEKIWQQSKPNCYLSTDQDYLEAAKAFPLYEQVILTTLLSKPFLVKQVTKISYWMTEIQRYPAYQDALLYRLLLNPMSVTAPYLQDLLSAFDRQDQAFIKMLEFIFHDSELFNRFFPEQSVDRGASRFRCIVPYLKKIPTLQMLDSVSVARLFVEKNAQQNPRAYACVMPLISDEVSLLEACQQFKRILEERMLHHTWSGLDSIVLQDFERLLVRWEHEASWLHNIFREAGDELQALLRMRDPKGQLFWMAQPERMTNVIHFIMRQYLQRGHTGFQNAAFFGQVLKMIQDPKRLMILDESRFLKDAEIVLSFLVEIVQSKKGLLAVLNVSMREAILLCVQQYVKVYFSLIDTPSVQQRQQVWLLLQEGQALSREKIDPFWMHVGQFLQQLSDSNTDDMQSNVALFEWVMFLVRSQEWSCGAAWVVDLFNPVLLPLWQLALPTIQIEQDCLTQIQACLRDMPEPKRVPSYYPLGSGSYLSPVVQTRDIKALLQVLKTYELEQLSESDVVVLAKMPFSEISTDAADFFVIFFHRTSHLTSSLVPQCLLGYLKTTFDTSFIKRWIHGILPLLYRLWPGPRPDLAERLDYRTALRVCLSFFGRAEGHLVLSLLAKFKQLALDEEQEALVVKTHAVLYGAQAIVSTDERERDLVFQDDWKRFCNAARWGSEIAHFYLQVICEQALYHALQERSVPEYVLAFCLQANVQVGALAARRVVEQITQSGTAEQIRNRSLWLRMHTALSIAPVVPMPKKPCIHRSPIGQTHPASANGHAPHPPRCHVRKQMVIPMPREENGTVEPANADVPRLVHGIQ